MGAALPASLTATSDTGEAELAEKSVLFEQFDSPDVDANGVYVARGIDIFTAIFCERVKEGSPELLGLPFSFADGREIDSSEQQVGESRRTSKKEKKKKKRLLKKRKKRERKRKRSSERDEKKGGAAAAASNSLTYYGLHYDKRPFLCSKETAERSAVWLSSPENARWNLGFSWGFAGMLFFFSVCFSGFELACLTAIIAVGAWIFMWCGLLCTKS